jgi:AraC-like DNA-binding protein
MKAQIESIKPDQSSSFRVLQTPHLENIFYWHVHPEYEIVYIEGTNGTRHIGDHISRYEDSDLAFIGPNIPHLNFDYGVKPDHEKIVVQLKEDFLGKEFLLAPELADVKRLFDAAKTGLVFKGKTKAIVGEKLKALTALKGFKQLNMLLDIFQTLAESTEKGPLSPEGVRDDAERHIYDDFDVTKLNIQPLLNNQAFKEQQRLKNIHNFVEQNYTQTIDFQVVVALSNLSNAAFCRYFRRMTGMTFTDYLNQYRINQAKQLLLQDYSVTETCYACGFENLSYFNKSFRRWVGENPLGFKKRHIIF